MKQPQHENNVGLYLISLTISIGILWFVGYGLSTQCPGVASNVYVFCQKSAR